VISEPLIAATEPHAEHAPAQDGTPQLARLTFEQPRASDVAVDSPLLPARVSTTGTRRRLYETALRQFGERGYHAVSVRDLVGELGLQASTLYSHVASKQHLLADLIRIGHEEHRDTLRLALLDAGSEPDDQVKVLVRAHVRFHCAYPLLARVCNRELGSLDDEQRTEILAIRLDAERLFFDVIERGHRLGAFQTSEPVLAVAAIGAMGIRVAEWWQPTLGYTEDQVADTYAEFAVRLLS
jgi:AcrR family transcriptional regulator